MVTVRATFAAFGNLWPLVMCTKWSCVWACVCQTESKTSDPVNSRKSFGLSSPNSVCLVKCNHCVASASKCSWMHVSHSCWAAVRLNICRRGPTKALKSGALCKGQHAVPPWASSLVRLLKRRHSQPAPGKRVKITPASHLCTLMHPHSFLFVSWTEMFIHSVHSCHYGHMPHHPSACV